MAAAGTVDGSSYNETTTTLSSCGIVTYETEVGRTEVATIYGDVHWYGTITLIDDGIDGWATVEINLLGTVATTAVGTLVGNNPQVMMTLWV